MKKMSRALFTGALIFALFSGCAPKEASQSAGGSGKTKIAVWHSFVGSDQRAEFMAARLEEFKALHPELEIEEQKFPRDQYQTRLKTLAAAGTLPESFLMWPNTPAREFAEAGLLADINDFLAAESAWKNGMIPSVLDQFTFDGKTYSAGLGVSLTSIVFYNKALFDKFGVAVPETYQELKTAIETFTANGVIPIAQGNKAKWPAQSTLFSIIADRITGSQWLDDVLKNRGPKFTDQPFIDALYIMKDLADSGAFNRDYNSIDEVQMRGYFYRGEAAMMIGGSWILPGMIADAPAEMKEHIEMTVFPAIPNGAGDPATISGVSSTGFGISAKANPEQRKALQSFIQFLTNDDAQKMYMNYYIPVSSTTVEPDLSTVDPLYAKMVRLIKAHPVLVPVYDGSLTSEQTEIINNGLQGVMLGESTPEGLAEDLARTVR